MSNDQIIILNRLLDKLSAVRATLKNDERVLLDSMVLNARIVVAADEVEQHGLTARPTSAAEAKVEAGAATSRVVSSADEVVQHGMTSRPVSAADAAVEAGAATSRKESSADEVEQHFMEFKEPSQAQSKAVASAVTDQFITIALDEESESYITVF